MLVTPLYTRTQIKNRLKNLIRKSCIKIISFLM
nr:MAG TPA: hypothetical protein [Caudoviricetes sp.]